MSGIENVRGRMVELDEAEIGCVAAGGVLLSDGVLLGDGVLLSDGVLVGDRSRSGVLVGD